MGALLDLAARYPAAVIPGYTHMRRAQAVLWPHYLLAYFEMFARDGERLREARARANVSPLGSGALAGSGFPFDRAPWRATWISSPSPTTVWTPSRTAISPSIFSTRPVAMLHLSRLAEDWILYSSEDFGWLELADSVTSGSSLMPQKKNPDSLELIRGKWGRVIGSFTSLMVTMKGLPMTYNRDMQEDKVPLFEAADELAGALEMARVTVESATLHPAKPAAAAEESWVVATDLAEALARAGTPSISAHQIVGALRPRKHTLGKKPSRLDCRRDARLRPRIYRRISPPPRPSPRHGIARAPRRHGPKPSPRRSPKRAPASPKCSEPVMSKSYRQGQILKLIRAKPIATQEELASELKALGIAATQVTLSRDIRALRLAKTHQGYREMEAGKAAPNLPCWPPSSCTTSLRAKSGGAAHRPRPRQFRGGGAR